MATVADFVVLSDKTLHHAATPAHLAYCPSMDLVALATTDQQVLIYRMNGQRVYSSLQKSGKLEVASVRWKPNGQLLAIASKDGLVRLVGAESSKIVHQFSTGQPGNDVTCLGWSTNLTDRKTNFTRPKKPMAAWNSLFAHTNVDEVLNLPRDLSLIDVETSLPKLSVLAAGSSDDVFSSRPSLEALFKPFDPKDNNSIDVMVVGTAEGRIHLSIYDSFVIGSFPPPVTGNGMASTLCLHASHQKCSTHALLFHTSDGHGLTFVPMDLRLISASSEYLSLLASRSTALQNLLRYIKQVQVQMVTEWRNAQELPGRFLSNINETLAEKDNRDIVQAFYHSVATGHTFPSVREWLVDELAERGHKRWDKAVTTGLENLKRLVHENMLPALERCSLILSRFSGISKFQGTNSALGFTNQQITLIMDTIACLHLVSSKILIQTIDELDLFTSFSTWLRYEIDRLATDTSTSPGDDLSDKEASIDHNKVLTYLQTAMIASPLSIYLADSTEEPATNTTGLEPGTPLYETLEKQIHKYESGLAYTKQLPRVENLCKILTDQTSTVFGQIAEAEKRNVLFGTAHEVGQTNAEAPIDMRMATESTLACETYIAFTPQASSNTVQIVRFSLSIENGISSCRSAVSSSIKLGNGTIKDLKFWTDSELLVLWEADNVTSLLTIPYEATDTSRQENFTMSYAPHGAKSKATTPATFSNQEVLDRFAHLELPEQSSFKPMKLEIRKGVPGAGGDDQRRLLLLSEDALHYRVLKFSTKREDEDVSMT